MKSLSLASKRHKSIASQEIRRRWKTRNRRSLLESLESRVLLAADPANVIAQLQGHSENASEISFQVHVDDFVSARGTQVLTFRVDAAAGSSLDPAAALVRNASGTVYPLNFSRSDLAGSTSSVVVAELTPGHYTLDIGAEGGSSGVFDVSVGLAGDLNGDGQVQLNDRSALIGLLRGRNYQVEADVNLDGRLTSFDTGHLLHNLGVVTSIAPLALTASLDPETEASLADGTSLTRVSAQTVVGQTNPGATARMDVDGDQQYETNLTVENAGFFSSSVDLTEGLNMIGVIANDRFGQHSETVIEVMLDTEPGQTVSLYRSGDLTSVVATVTADSAGAYQFVGQAVSLDTNLFTAVTSDAAGNTSQANLNVMRVPGDEVPPVVHLSLVADTGESSSDFITNNPILTALLSDQNEITVVQAALDGSDAGSLENVTASVQARHQRGQAQ